MGVCEGIPSSIMPDHSGRADYHGTSINQAARFMDAAAHGGQVACEEHLAVSVLARWGQVLAPRIPPSAQQHPKQQRDSPQRGAHPRREAQFGWLPSQASFSATAGHPGWFDVWLLLLKY